MRKRQSFLLTIITPDTEDASFCGRIKVISSGKTCTFTNLEELYRLITAEMGEDVLQHFSQSSLSQNCSEANSSPRSKSFEPGVSS
jgi:hypothetical protein